jgi:methylated-DNA-[protein]-cysteine S-methyltransferase
MILYHVTTQSPIGELHVVASRDGLCAVAFEDRWELTLRQLERRFRGSIAFEEGDPHSAADRLDAYFDGDVAALDRLPVDAGGTEFQRRVWDALRRIPAGTTVSYGSLARDIGHEAAVRAVGAANGQNPVAIVVPCHRVIGGNGQLTGYAGGLDRKRWLLEHEGKGSAARAAARA